MIRKLVIFGLILALAAIPLAACAPPAPAPAPAPAPEIRAINFYSADPGGSWYPTAIALSAIWESNIPDISFTHLPGGGASNVQAINDGIADVAISTSISVGDALVGNPPFEKPISNFGTMGAFLADVYNIITVEGTGIETLADLKGKRLCAAKQGWTAETVCKRQLEAVGLTYDDLAKVEFVTPSEGVELIKDGHLDASIIGFDLAGDPQLTELTVFKPIKILPVPDDILAKLQAQNPGIMRVTIPGGIYKGVDEDVPGITGATGLIANPDLPEDLAYMMTRFMAENWVGNMQLVLAELAKIQPQDLARQLGCDYVAGAARYYREVGWIQ